VFNGLTALGSSSIFSTARDMAAWLINFDSAKIGGRFVLDRMHSRVPLNDGGTNEYAYGLSHGEYRGQETWGHSGSWAGFRSHLLHFPNQGFGVVILSNLGSFDPGSRAYRIADIFLADVLDAEGADGPGATNRPGVPVAGTLLDEYEGTYRLGPGWYVQIHRRGSSLQIQATGESTFPMTSVSETEFWVQAYGASIHFLRDDLDRVNRIAYRQYVAPRVSSFDASDLRLDDYVGEYVSEELDTAYTISMENGSLVAHHFRHGRIPLAAVYLDEFTSPSWFFSPVTFVRDGDGRVSEFLVGRGRARNLRFRKASD
jgi:hypothetical protein